MGLGDSSDRVQGTLQLPSPTTRKQSRAFLGLTGYCRIWIPNYGLIAQPLYESLKGWDDSIQLMWGTPQKKAEATLKQALTQAPSLRLPDPKKAFQLYVHEREIIALGVLTQRLGSEPQLLAYLSKRLDPTYQGCSLSLRNLTPIEILIEEALKLSFGGRLTIFTSHEVKQLLNGRGRLWMSDQRILRYQVELMENPGPTISPCEVLDPATLLPTPKGSLPFHSCLETLDHWTKSREGLLEDPLTNPEEIRYTHGSSFVLDGKRGARYAIVSNFETTESKPLLPGQQAPTSSASSTRMYETTANHGKYYPPLDGL